MKKSVTQAAIAAALGSGLMKMDVEKVRALAQGLALELRDQSRRLQFVRDLSTKIISGDASLLPSLPSMVLQIEVDK